ncbi:hypothetical protein [Piscibacillus salipiscarius]|uniref:Uncharacterized protein n=1 Tax=Piscibacillus salipiscarius TaxID=299480 RepID=A0ABW5Q9M0_9BACI|nr:hypothetical protein [Piscibacillus salipiscarius]
MINSLTIKVNNIQFVHTGEEPTVNIHFRGVDPDNQLNVNGYVPVTNDEYEANSGVNQLEQLVREKLTERMTV